MEHASARSTAQIGAVALIASLFLPWYELSLTQLSPALSEVTPSFTALRVLNGPDYALAALGAVALLQLKLANRGLMARLFALSGGFAAAFIAVEIVSPPFGFLSAVGLEISREPAIFLALASASAIAYGGWIQLRAELRASGEQDRYDAYAPVGVAAGAGAPRPAHGVHSPPTATGAPVVTSPAELFAGPAARSGSPIERAAPRQYEPDPFAVRHGSNR
jgi:hypothetical protein